MIRSCISEAEDHQKLSTRSWHHQKLKVIRSWSSSEAEDWNLQFVRSCYSEGLWLQKEWKPGATANSEEFEGIRCLSTEERLKRTKLQLYNHCSILHVCNSTRIQLHLCSLLSIHGMDLKLFLHRTITKSSNISLVIWSSFTTLLMCWRFPTYLSYLYIKEWRPEDWQDSYNNFTNVKPLLKLFHIIVHLEIL
jgi:hypothetical protein